MGRLILIVLILLLVLWLLRRALSAGKPPVPPGGGVGAPNLVTCAHCGINLPKGEARSAGGRHYCSEEHWRLGPRED